jgi:hypothetical protein
MVSRRATPDQRRGEAHWRRVQVESPCTRHCEDEFAAGPRGSLSPAGTAARSGGQETQDSFTQIQRPPTCVAAALVVAARVAGIALRRMAVPVAAIPFAATSAGIVGECTGVARRTAFVTQYAPHPAAATGGKQREGKRQYQQSANDHDQPPSAQRSRAPIEAAFVPRSFWSIGH